MAKVGTLDARLARLQEQIRKAKEASSAVKRRKRAALRDNEKRRVWIVGTCAMAAMGERRMRELIARELSSTLHGQGGRQATSRRRSRRPAGIFVPSGSDREVAKASARQSSALTAARASLKVGARFGYQ